MTAQFSDWLHYQGQKHELCSNPLESYFDDEHPRPDFKASSTACWRGYVATWEIENDTLYLVSGGGIIAIPPLVVKGSDNVLYTIEAKEVGLKDLFPLAGDRVKATWFTGVLRIPQGELLEYVHAGYGSTFEEDLLLTIEAGNLVHTEVRDNREFFAEEAWLDQIKVNCTEILCDLFPSRCWQWLLCHLPLCVGRGIVIGVRGIVVVVFVLILPFFVPYVIYKRGWNPRKWNLLWVNELLEENDEGRPTWWRELPTSEMIFAIILGPIFIVMVPFMVPHLLYKHGWNPKKWGLLWRPRRLVRKVAKTRNGRVPSQKGDT